MSKGHYANKQHVTGHGFVFHAYFIRPPFSVLEELILDTGTVESFYKVFIFFFHNDNFKHLNMKDCV